MRNAWEIWLFKLRNLRHRVRSFFVPFTCWLCAMSGGLTVYGTLRATVLRKDGSVLDYGLLGYRVVTNAGVGFLADDFVDGSAEITNMKYHASGTGAVAENVTDTALGAEVTDNARAAGTNTNPSANVYRSVNTISYTGAHAITEHGIFNQVTVAGSILWDRTVFGQINVGAGDSIQFTYDLTINAGG